MFFLYPGGSSYILVGRRGEREGGRKGRRGEQEGGRKEGRIEGGREQRDERREREQR